MAESIPIQLKNGNIVDVPEDIVERGDRASIQAYIVESGQAEWEDVLNEAEVAQGGVAPPADIGGPFNAAMISAGETVSRFGSNLGQAFSQLTGDKAGAQERIDAQAESRRLTSGVREQFPKSSFAGSMLPAFAVPGGKLAQLGFGAVEGALEGDTAAERALGGGIGLGAGFVGQKAGDALGQRVNRAFQSATNNPRAPAIEEMARRNIPLTPGQRTRDPMARLTDDLRGIILNSRNVLEGKQNRVINRMALNTIGESGDEVTMDALGRAHTRIGNVFEDVADSVDDISVTPDQAARLSAIGDDVADVETQGATIRRQYERVMEAIRGGRPISGDDYNKIRNRLGKASRAAWRQGDELAAETADEVLETLDDALAASAPDLAEALTDARKQWRMLRILRKANTIDPENNVNANSMQRAFEAVYPGASVGKFSDDPAGQFGQTLARSREVIRPRQTSRTAENLIRFGALAGPTGALAAGADPIATLGTAGLIGLGAFGGGGAGGLLGGGLSRGILQAEPQVGPLRRRTQ